MTTIFFYSADKNFNFRGKRKLKEFLTQVFRKEKQQVDMLSYVFCSDEYLLNINQKFLQHDYYTDVITFNLSDNELIKGEVYISLDRIKENAKSAKIEYREELLRVMIHGALHLCDYNDKTKSEISQMRRKERQYLRLFTKISEND